MFSLAFRLGLLDDLVSLVHLISRILYERLPHVAYSIFNLLLEVLALWIVLGNVFQFPIALFCALILQCLIDEGVGATKFPRRFHSILEEPNFVRLCARSLDELILVARSFLLLCFYHRFLPLRSIRFQPRPYLQLDSMCMVCS